MREEMLLPGATIGIIGSGQLGRMLALVARTMGYRTVTYSPISDSPAGQVSDLEVVGDFRDMKRITDFVGGVDVVTFEFENVSLAVAEAAAAVGVPVRPDGCVLHVAQNRLREKETLHALGLPVTPFEPVRSLADLHTASRKLGLPLVVKSAAFGYDGKGQARVHHADGLEAAWVAVDAVEAVAEPLIDYLAEVSVVAARAVDGSIADYGIIENVHRNHILDISIAPGRLGAEIREAAVDATRRVLEGLDVYGVLCVEFFVQSGGALLLNEVAPRPHNSGHLTLDACSCSQFEQQLRAVCGLPLGPTDLRQPAVMVNLLGDLWTGGEPNWAHLLCTPDCYLHLYGKREPRPGRKMGHFTVLRESTEEALATGRELQTKLTSSL